jgi:hypothetical protein
MAAQSAKIQTSHTMNTPPRIHLVVIQPAGYVHALGFIDQARYLRFELRRLGAEVSLAKNRLRQDAVNIVFGAHLGFEAELSQRHSCIFFNLEQLGAGGAQVSPAYLKLLRQSAVVDYNAENLPAYCEPGQEMPVVPFLFAPYLRPEQSPPLEERPIDLLFFGSMNPRRRAFLDRIEATGREVASFDRPLYGPERDAFIRQAKAVVNCHFYESSRFEQVRASHCLSLGTPFISERGPQTRPTAAFDEAVFWLDERNFERFFTEEFAQPAFFEAAYEKLIGFQRHDPIADYAELLAFAQGFQRGDAARLAPRPWRPTRINLGSGKDYKPGWLNIDVLDRAEPDLVLDLGQAVRLPIAAAGLLGGQIELAAGSVERIYANNVLEHVPDLPMLMGNALALLKDNGVFEIEVPYEKATTAWQDPTHLRALNENSWVYYTDWFWYLGWFEHRFSMLESSWLDVSLKPCTKDSAAFMRVKLKKQPTTAAERMTARVMRADFGGIPDDLDIFEDAAATA